MGATSSLFWRQNFGAKICNGHFPKAPPLGNEVVTCDGKRLSGRLYEVNSTAKKYCFQKVVRPIIFILPRFSKEIVHENICLFHSSKPSG